MRRLLLFASGYPGADRPNLGIFTHRSALALRKKFEVEVVHFRAFNFKRKALIKEHLDGLTVYRVAVPQVPHFEKPFLIKLNIFLYRIFGWFLLNKIIKKVDVLHSTGLIPTALIAQYWAKKAGKKHISQSIGDDVNIYLKHFKSSFWKKQIAAITCHQFNSQALQNQFDNTLSLPINKFVAYRGVDTTYFSAKPHYLLSKKIQFLYLGGMQSYQAKDYETLNVKGGHILMEAWSLLEKNHENIALHFGGPGIIPTKMTDWLEKLKNVEAVEIGGRIHPKEVAKKLQSYDIVIIPSLFEGLPNLANEAQASCVPVIGTDAGGIKESVIHQKTGLIVPKNNAKSLMAAMEWFILNNEKIEEFGKNGRQRMCAEISWEQYVLKLENAINN